MKIQMYQDPIYKLYERGDECLKKALRIVHEWPMGEYSQRIQFDIRTAAHQQMILRTIEDLELWVKALTRELALHDKRMLIQLTERLKFALTKEDFKQNAIEDAERIRQEFLSLVTSRTITSRRNSSQPKIQKNTAFIIMALGQRPHLQDTCSTIKRVCKLHGFDAFRADDLQHGGLIIDRIHESIASAEILIGDLTLERPNVYYEVGVANGQAKEPMLFRRKGTKLPFDLAAYNVPEYRSYFELESLLTDRLKALSNN